MINPEQAFPDTVNEGFSAHGNGLEQWNNPYSSISQYDQFLAWKHGWHKAWRLANCTPADDDKREKTN